MSISRSLMTLLPLLVLAGFAYLAYLIIHTTPDVKQMPVTAPKVSVETHRVVPVAYPVKISSFGRVQPRTQSNLVAQVTGQIIEISENFQSGGFVKKNEVLIRTDPVDYEVQIDIAQGELVEAELALEEEQARVSQARKDWQKIGGLESASDLALRIPQLRAANARVSISRARLKQAEVNLRRTSIKAPYEGRLLNTHVDFGDIITPQLVLAEMYATDYVELRLPLKSADLAYITLPEFSTQSEAVHYPEVSFNNTLVSPAEQWQGKIMRTEGAIDANTQQLFVIAQINDPFELRGDDASNPRDKRRYPLKIGQYLPATIEGRTIDQAIVIPSSVIYQGSFVYLVQNDLLIRRNISLGFQGRNDSLVLKGVEAGDELVLTTLGQVTSGTSVTRVPGNESSPDPAGAIAGNSGKDPHHQTSSKLPATQAESTEKPVTVTQ